MKLVCKLLLPFCAVLLAACTHTSEIGYEKSQTPPEEVLKSLRGTEAVIAAKDSGEFEGTITGVSHDTILITSEDSGFSRSIPLQSVERMYLEGSPWGPILGFLGGTAVGSAIGYSAFWKGEDDVGRGIFAMIIGTLGGIGGTIAGANITPAMIYVAPPGGIKPKISASGSTNDDAKTKTSNRIPGP
jgi:hypothetical protein